MCFSPLNTRLRRVQTTPQVALQAEVIYKKSGKGSKQTVRPTKIEKRPVLYLTIGA